VRFATLTHAAGISSTGDPELDARLPFDEPYFIPSATAIQIQLTKAEGGRVVAIGTTVVRALEHAAGAGVSRTYASGYGLATGRIGRDTRLRVVDAIVSGVHERGTSHFELLQAFHEEAALARMSEEVESNDYLAHEFGDTVLLWTRVSAACSAKQTSAVRVA
jgi:S-adenosylmethionine:tRNA ribosyltransferase-isomerase